jgi:predicted acetyltransferase
MILRELLDSDEESFLSFLDGWEDAPGFLIAFDLLNDSSFASYLSFLEQSVLKGEHSLFAFLDREMIGKVNIRRDVETESHSSPGHIGFGVSPKYRGKGYGALLLRDALLKCQNMGLKKVLITCQNSNLASVKTIQTLGGVLEVKDQSSKLLRFWIEF